MQTFEICSFRSKKALDQFKNEILAGFTGLVIIVFFFIEHESIFLQWILSNAFADEQHFLICVPTEKMS